MMNHFVLNNIIIMVDVHVRQPTLFPLRTVRVPMRYSHFCLNSVESVNVSCRTLKNCTQWLATGRCSIVFSLTSNKCKRGIHACIISVRHVSISCHIIKRLTRSADYTGLFLGLKFELKVTKGPKTSPVWLPACYFACSRSQSP